MNGITTNQMTDHQQPATHSNTHDTITQPPSSHELRATAARRKRTRSNSTVVETPTDTAGTAPPTSGTSREMSSPMKRQRRKTPMIIDSIGNEPIEMKRMDEDEKSDGPAFQTARVTVHSTIRHILHLDQTAQRLCASLLERKEIIAFGRSCHATYSTLNHPLPWQHTHRHTIGLDPLPTLPNGIDPFLQHLPVTWKISAGDTNIALRLPQQVSQLEHLPRRYRLTGLSVYPTLDDIKNGAITEVLILLLHDPRVIRHLSTIFLMNCCIWDGTLERRFFIPTQLLSAILQLPYLDRLHVQIRELTPELMNQFSQVHLPLSQLEVCLTNRPSRESIIPLGRASLCQGLVKLTLSGCNSALDWNSDYLIGLSQLRTLHLVGWLKYLPIIPTLSQMVSLRHLYITHMIEDEPKPRLFQFIDGLDTSVPHLDTISIQLTTRSRGLTTPCLAVDTPLLRELQQFVRERHGPSQPHPPSHRLFVRLRKTEVFGCL